MTLTACVVCHRKDLHTRWVGAIQALYCDSCGCLYFSESAPAEGVSTLFPPRDRRAPRSSEPADPAPVASLPVAASVTKASPAH